MREGLVSVVLPIYGVEKYLDRCVSSVVNQTYSNLEIILVDDGSLDNSPQMCDAWAKKDSRIKVIHKANAGLGMARNTGIEHATGEYICFFDSDDYVSLDTVERAYVLAKREKSDIVVFGLSNVNNAGTVVNAVIPKTDKVTYVGDEVQSVFLPDLIATVGNSRCCNIYMSACVCLYSMEMIRKSGWRFASEREIISEDVYSLLCLYRYVKQVSVLQEALYFYCENATSLTHVYRPDRYEKICHFHQSCVNKAHELGYTQEVVNRLQGPFVSFAIATMKMIVCADCSEQEKISETRKIIKSDYIRFFSWYEDINPGSNKRKIFDVCLRKQWFWPCYLFLKLTLLKIGKAV